MIVFAAVTIGISDVYAFPVDACILDVTLGLLLDPCCGARSLLLLAFFMLMMFLLLLLFLDKKFVWGILAVASFPAVACYPVGDCLNDGTKLKFRLLLGDISL